LLSLPLVRVRGLEQLHKHRVECSNNSNTPPAVLRSRFCKQNLRVKNHQLYQTNRKGIRNAYPFSVGAGKRTVEQISLRSIAPLQSKRASTTPAVR